MKRQTWKQLWKKPRNTIKKITYEPILCTHCSGSCHFYRYRIDNDSDSNNNNFGFACVCDQCGKKPGNCICI